ncbi:hypothetical protein L2E82_39068 [Cichorium intybus]|uniref:Uncharacterized protein n=1 Tax=Cichorium intybus TaxID=13427 RepID=A0ACB9AIW4_CICIN|nr:hypothetical protein L2E82_39068 [Cichorium intybus]
MAMATRLLNLLFVPNYERRFKSPPPLSKAWRSSPVKLVIKNQSQTQSLQKKKRRPENVDGEFFVDHTCIDCDTCRWMAPEVFTRVNGMSAVSKQPSCQDERLKALQGVYHCGYHSDKSYGAASYLIVHPEGNILIDSPRYTERLASNIENMGGARYMFLTHRGSVADHKKWSERLGCTRILNSTEVNVSMRDVEMKLDGCGPWSLNDDIQLIHTPGHTVGSVCLFYKPLKVLFTGHHLAMEESELAIFERYNYYSVAIQLDSVAMLLELDFEWILPGHARRVVYKDVEEKNSSLKAFLTAKQHVHGF